jgi:hypothetical protein
VIPKDPYKTALCSGSFAYPFAIITSLNPFEMKSVHGDMTWHKEDINDYKSINDYDE